MVVPIARLYILRIFLRYLAFSLAVFAGLLVMLNFVQMVNQGVLGGFSAYFLAKSLLYTLPGILGTSLPLAFLLAMLLSLGQMSQDGEIIALRAGGFSFFDIFSWVLWAAAASSLLLLFLNNWAGPRTLKRSTDYMYYMLNRVTKVDLKPRTFQKVSDWVLYAGEVNPLSGGMRGVRLVRFINRPDGPGFVTRVNADRGRYRVESDRGMALDLYDGQFSQTDCRDDSKALHGGFASYATVLPFFSGDALSRKLHQRELTTGELLARLKAGVADAGLAAKYRIEAASRFALAVAPLVFFLVGAPLGVALDKRGRSAGFALSLLVTFFYYGLTISGMVLARKMPALFPWAIFAPALLAAAAGGYFWKRKLSGR